MIFIAKNHNSFTQDWLNYYNINNKILSDSDILSESDFLILTGGSDLGKKQLRDDFDIHFLKQALNLKIPILGICRGMQLVNTFLGGTLTNNIESSINHETDRSNNESRFHLVSNEIHSFYVNSRHHQSIETLATNFKINYKSIDGIIESIEKDNILLIQWHPELLDVRGFYCEQYVLNFIKKFNK